LTDFFSEIAVPTPSVLAANPSAAPSSVEQMKQRMLPPNINSNLLQQNAQSQVQSQPLSNAMHTRTPAPLKPVRMRASILPTPDVTANGKLQ